MIRTNIVKLTVIPAIAFRQKLTAGGSGITILRPDVQQPGIASISNSTGEPIINRQTDIEKYPAEAFREAMELTLGMPYRKQNNVKVTEAMVAEPLETDEEPAEEEAVLNEEAYQKVVEHYTDKSGHLSYDLINKEMIKFAHASTIVSKMIEEGDSEEALRNYIVSNKLRNIAENDDLSDGEIGLIVKLIDEVSPKGVFKELNSELRKLMKNARKA